MDDFFGSLSSDINEQDAEAAEALKREKEAKRNAQANPIRPQDEVPKLEYFEVRKKLIFIHFPWSQRHFNVVERPRLRNLAFPEVHGSNFVHLIVVS